MSLISVEMCAGAGGQALGLEKAGFDHEALVEIESPFCLTLKTNRPQWNVHNLDLKDFDGRPYKGVDLLAGGLPCPPFSIAGKQLGKDDERDLFPTAIRLINEIKPRAIMIENVKGLLSPSFGDYREYILGQLKKLGYTAEWRLLNASSFGVPQLRPRAILVGLQKNYSGMFSWPEPLKTSPPSVGDVLHDLMAENGWRGAKRGARKQIASPQLLLAGLKSMAGLIWGRHAQGKHGQNWKWMVWG